MRTLKTFYSVMGDLMWVLTVPAAAILAGLAPTLGAWPVPFFGNVVQAFIYLMAPALVLLVVFNLLSGRWPAEGWHRTRNIWVSGLAFFALAAILIALFVVNHGYTGLPTALTVELPGNSPYAGTWTFNIDLLAKWAVVGLTGFAFIDWWFTKGEEYVASSMNNTAIIQLQRQLQQKERENEQLRAQIAAMGANSTAAASPGGPVPQATPVIRIGARTILDAFAEMPAGSMIQVPPGGLTLADGVHAEFVRVGNYVFLKKLAPPAQVREAAPLTAA